MMFTLRRMIHVKKHPSNLNTIFNDRTKLKHNQLQVMPAIIPVRIPAGLEISVHHADFITTAINLGSFQVCLIIITRVGV